MTAPTGFELADKYKYDLAAQILTLLALYAVLSLGLLAAFLAGVLVYELVHVVAPWLRVGGITHRTGKVVALALIAVVAILLLSSGVAALTSLLTDRSDNVVVLMQKMADTVQTARTHLPVWAQNYMPPTTEELQKEISQWLRAHASDLQSVGENLGRLLFHIIVGAVIGGLAALGEASPKPATLPPLRRALVERAELLGGAFSSVVFAQGRISALNTVLTALFLIAVLPALGVNLPLAKTLIAVTFLAGLLPVIGNLISNTAIVVVSLSVSPYAAVGALIFLVAIHKLEYFVNARIIGSQIRARAWELLVAMLVMEAWFGIAGVIAAPIYYAYVKDELSARGLV
jgi:predicted PurR-regulated permease PerM